MLQVSETVFDTINHEYDKTEQKRAKQKKAKFGTDEKDSDCILHGYIKKLVKPLSWLCWSKYYIITLQGGPFESAWQTRYAKLYPNRLELHPENNKAQLIFMEDIEDINTELVTVGLGNLFKTTFMMSVQNLKVITFQQHVQHPYALFTMNDRCDKVTFSLLYKNFWLHLL